MRVRVGPVRLISRYLVGDHGLNEVRPVRVTRKSGGQYGSSKKEERDAFAGDPRVEVPVADLRQL